MASAGYATAPVNGTSTPSPAEDEDLYTQLLRLRDVVIAGKHALIQLPPTAIERLKASLIVPNAQAQDSQQSYLSSGINATAFSTNQTQLNQTSSLLDSHGFASLSATSIPNANGSDQAYGAKRQAAAGLDPIFLEKSDSLVRAEGQLKRQRLDRDLQAQVEQRKHSSRDRDPGAEAPSPIDIDYVLLTALERVRPVSGLKETGKSDASSSFDENDYYSSQVQSDWSSAASSSKASDKAAGAFTADFERLDGAPSKSAPFAQRSSHRKTSISGASKLPPASRDRPHVYTHAPEDVYEVGDDDDEYTPPDATAFDGFHGDGTGMDMGQLTPPDDDNSDYEPGEITDSNIPTPPTRGPEPSQPSPRVPVIRNHLTHIVAPQPNRVSPLATAKGPSIELELVNGRPEVVQKSRPHQNNVHSRASTASPSGNGAGGSGKKKRNKKRKRDDGPTGRAKRRRDRQAVLDSNAPHTYDEPYIKDEPLSPPPFATLPDVPPYPQLHDPQRPVEYSMSSPRYPLPMQHTNEYAGSGLRYENAQPTSPTFVRVASPSINKQVHRDTQDLRRVASLHVAQQLPSPQQRAYSPVAPYRTASMTYGDTQQGLSVPRPEDRIAPRYQDPAVPDFGQYRRDERSRSPPQPHEYRETYVPRAPSPASMPPPAAPPRKIIVDQNGNRYYAAEPVSMPRASAAPFERRPQSDVAYERIPSLAATSYGQSPVTNSAQYGLSDGRMPPPIPPVRKQAATEQRVSHVDTSNYYSQDYNSRPLEPNSYNEAPTSPIYQRVQGYEPISSAQHYSGGPTSPMYIPTRTYSVRPEEPQQVLRHASVAPVQYVRRDAPGPARAVSVMPSADHSALAPQHQRTFSQAPQGIRYVDQYGNEVFPREVRQVSEYRY